jgi:hypothetical protein
MALMDIEAEKIGVKRITLRRNGVHGMLSVGSFASADSSIKRWTSSSRGIIKCEFEIVYNDDSVYAGALEAALAPGKQATLTSHLRSIVRSCESLCGPAAPHPPIRGSASKGRFVLPVQLREHYEIDDHCLDFYIANKPRTVRQA